MAILITPSGQMAHELGSCRNAQNGNLGIALFDGDEPSLIIEIDADEAVLLAKLCLDHAQHPLADQLVPPNAYSEA